MEREAKGHVIVCGLHGLGLRIVERLRHAGVAVVVVDSDPEIRLARVVIGWGVTHLSDSGARPETLLEAGLAGAAAIICVERTDLRNLEIALLARELRPDVRVIAHIANDAVGRALGAQDGKGDPDGLDSVLNVAALAAPSIVEACMHRTVHDLDLDGLALQAVRVEAPRAGTLRELYGDLAPVAVTAPGAEPTVCPGRDHPVGPGDRVTLIGAGEEIAHLLPEKGRPEKGRPEKGGRRTLRSRLPRPVSEGNKGLRRAIGALLSLVAVSTLVLRFGYVEPGMSLLDGLYFSIETIATVGFGDFSFAQQPTWLRLYATGLMVVGVTCTAITFAYLTDLLISRRLELSSGRRVAAGLSGHIIVVGLGRVGVRVARELAAHGRRVVVVERSTDNPYLGEVRALGIPVIFGDATLPATLDAARLGTAAAVAVVTSDDMVNIEAGLAVRDLLGARWARVPVMLRLFDHTLARTVARRFGFHHVRSTADLASPWFVGAALGLDVLNTFTAGSLHFLLGRFTVAPGSGLDGLALNDLSSRIRVVAVRRGPRWEYPPRRGTRLRAGDQAYAVGSYEELLDVLQRGRTPERHGDPRR